MNFPTEGGISNLTRVKEDQEKERKNGGDRKQYSGKNVESALLELCREIAGTLLRGIQKRQNPYRVRSTLCEDLQRVGGFSPDQAESLVDLAIELIRAKSSGEYRRDESGISSLVTRALGGNDSEGLN